MKSGVRSQKSEVRRRRIFLFCLLYSVSCLLSCSIPNLESPECSEAQTTVREFYSFHFGNDMKFSLENLKPREKFLTPEFVNSLKQNAPSDIDVFTTQTTDFPKAFRVGGCSGISPDSVTVEVLLFWKDSERSDQKKIYVDVVRQNGKWLINGRK